LNGEDVIVSPFPTADGIFLPGRRKGYSLGTNLAPSLSGKSTLRSCVMLLSLIERLLIASIHLAGYMPQHAENRKKHEYYCTESKENPKED